MLRGLIVDYYGVLTDSGVGPGELPLVGTVAAARARGLRTALMSNTDSLAADALDWDALFDTILLSGEIGVGKPDPRIYLLAADRLRLIPEQCVFVDDLRANVRAAAQLGMVGVHHTGVEATLTELEALFGFSLT